MYNQLKKTISDGTTQLKKVAGDVNTDIARGAQTNNINSPLPSKFADEVSKATKILISFTDPEKVDGGLDNVIPKEVFCKALGLAIFTVVKAGFGWSGRIGSGLVVAKLNDEIWSSPSCINIGGLGIGLQLGADITDFVVLLNTPEAVKAFSRGENVTLGGSLAVTAGPLGIGGEVSGTIMDAAPLYAYSRSKGLFAGVSLEGTMIVERKDENSAFYGRDVSSEDILCGKVEMPSSFTDISLYEAIKRSEKRESKNNNE